LNILEKSLLRGLSSEDISFCEVMNAFDIRTSIAFNLSSNIYGFVYVSRKGNYHIVLNGNINYETQCKVFLHEVKHITRDIPNIPYIIGIDMQAEEFEIEKIYSQNR
jgi:hypothetical protein